MRWRNFSIVAVLFELLSARNTSLWAGRKGINAIVQSELGAPSRQLNYIVEAFMGVIV